MYKRGIVAAATLATAVTLAGGTAVGVAAYAAPSGEPGIVAVTGSGSLVVLNPSTGATTRTLVSGNVLGDQITVAPSGKTVYFATAGCEIESVPVTGGHVTKIAAGSLPAISPGGTELAFAHEPIGGYTEEDLRCGPTNFQAKNFSLVVRNLATGSQRSYASPPGVSPYLPFPIAHLSWAPGGSRVAVSIGQGQDNSGMGLVLVNPATAHYYIPAGYTGSKPVAGQVPVTAGSDVSASYYTEGAFLPDGNLFVDRGCCYGTPDLHPSNVFWVVSTSGHLVQQVASASGSRIYSSLGADPSGHWLMYLSTGFLTGGGDQQPGKLFISRNGGAGVQLNSTSLLAAAWL